MFNLEKKNYTNLVHVDGRVTNNNAQFLTRNIFIVRVNCWNLKRGRGSVNRNIIDLKVLLKN